MRAWRADCAARRRMIRAWRTDCAVVGFRGFPSNRIIELGAGVNTLVINTLVINTLVINTSVSYPGALPVGRILR
jgi:hypothetical protein